MTQPNPDFVHPRVNRRSALRAGAIGILGLSINDLAALRSLAAASVARASAPSEAKAQGVIFIFLSGGLSHHDTFDMKPEAPLEVRGEFETIPTRTPGLRICEHLPLLAQRSHLWALCRSLTHSSNDHSAGHHIMLTGRSELPAGFDPNRPKESDWPSIAAVANRVLPRRHNLPPAIVLPEKLIHNTGRMIPGQFAGHMGPQRDPFFLETLRYNPQSYGAYPDYTFHHRYGAKDGTGFAFRSLSLSLPDELGPARLDNRLALLDSINRQQAFLDRASETQEMDRYRAMAVSLLADPKTKAAFDVEMADAKTQDRYGRNSFGRSLLMARQLVEAGVSLVQVNLGNNETWDTHEAVFPNLKNFLLPPLDRAVSALLDDLYERGMLSSTLVVMASEFGRTPKISTIAGASLPGRDHWGAAQTVFFAGGGVHGGAVLGSTDALGAYPASDPQTPENFAATIYHALGLPPTLAWADALERPHYVYHGKPMAVLFG